MNASPNKGGGPPATRKIVALGVFAAGIILAGGLFYYLNTVSPVDRVGGPTAPTSIEGPASYRPVPATARPTSVVKGPQLPTETGSSGSSVASRCFCEQKDGIQTGNLVCPSFDGWEVIHVADYKSCPPSPPATEEPPVEVNCFCEVQNNAWDGYWVCVNIKDGTPISKEFDTNKCPLPVCGNHVVEGTEACDGKACDDGSACNPDCTCDKTKETVKKAPCTCEFTATASGGIVGHCVQNPRRTCTESSP